MKCTNEDYDHETTTSTPCESAAVVRLTITGADIVKNPSASERRRPTPWNLDNAPRCAPHAARDRAIVAKLYPPGAVITETPVDP